MMTVMKSDLRDNLLSGGRGDRRGGRGRLCCVQPPSVFPGASRGVAMACAAGTMTAKAKGRAITGRHRSLREER